MRLELRGQFKVLNSDGEDITPRGQKERALLACLALSPESKRSRKWLQDLLWGSRFPEQASTSLRRAVYKMRSETDDLRRILHSDRTDIWLDPAPTVIWGEPGTRDLLEDISVSEPSYTDWIAKLRFKTDGVIAKRPEREHSRGGPERIILRMTAPPADPAGAFLARHLADTFARKLKETGPVTVEFTDSEDDTALEGRSDTIWTIELDCVVLDHDWLASVRIFGGGNRRFIWSGRLRLTLDLTKILNGVEIPNFVEMAISTASSREQVEGGTLTNFVNAAARVFLADRDELALADRIFSNLEMDDPAGIARAWRAYIGLTQTLEHNDHSDELVERTLAFAEDAERRAYGNALATALLAQVQMKVRGDFDRGRYLAEQAFHSGEHNPFALHAMSQAFVLGGDYLAGFKYAELGRKVSDGLPNSYCWDMQTCLAALGIGKRGFAYDLARLAHSKMPTYRPALRYLAALSLLDGRMDDSEKWSGRLKALEPGFKLDFLASQSYPVDTLRSLGLQDEMVSVWKS